MSSLTSIMTLHQSTETTVAWAMQRLMARGFQVERTFDLHAARLAQVDCTCPHHGTNDCTCQMIVLLVHRRKGPANDVCMCTAMMMKPACHWRKLQVRSMVTRALFRRCFLYGKFCRFSILQGDKNGKRPCVWHGCCSQICRWKIGV